MIATNTALISEQQDLAILEKENAENDSIYQQKIRETRVPRATVLPRWNIPAYSFIRKTHPERSCFYRAFGFSYLEMLLDDSNELQRFKAIAAKSKLDLVSHGFTEFTIEDFHNTKVEPMSNESNHVQIIALAKALNMCILVEYMNRGEGETDNHHIFPGDGDPKVCLLHKPGHYDIMYK